MSTAYIMVGLPGSGKSTWVKTQNWLSSCVLISTDYYIERFSKRYNISYSESFARYMSLAVKLMTKKILRAIANKKDIIWDQTSTTIRSRKKKINMLMGYKLIAVVMKPISRNELTQRLLKREKYKHIPDYVIDEMIEFYEIPSIVEGFSEIWDA